MKAEQRKELETNALADRMGHMMTRMKTQPRRTALYWVVGIAVLFVALFVLFRFYNVTREENSKHWRELENGTFHGNIELLLKEAPETTQGKAARFQFAWLIYWEAGVKRLGIEREKALEELDRAAKVYRDLEKDCENDPNWESEAMYALAVIEETHAIQDIDALDKAKVKYEKLVTKHKETARGKLADQWLKDFEDPPKRRELEAFYREMHTALNFPDLIPRKGLDFPRSKKDNTKPK